MSISALTVVGGAYGEECSFPRVRVFKGSGGRAASFLSSTGIDVTLHAYLGPQLAKQFDSQSKSFKFKLCATNKSYDIWFRYRHPLAHPDIHYFPHHPNEFESQLPQINVENALVFGMLEGRPVVRAKRVVYDPQDGANAKAFESNGSSANEVAMVVSHSEGIAITGETDPVQIAKKLRLLSGVVVAIVKCGPQGAFVSTNLDSSWIRAFPTSRVYKIGSGDIFSAAFAFAWLTRDWEPLRAAWFASRVTAEYVQTTLDRFRVSDLDRFEKDSNQFMLKYKSEEIRPIPQTQIYLAGPFFNTAQQWLIEEARTALCDMGFNVFSPIHEIGPGPAHDVAPADLKALDESGIVFAIMDGLDPGTIFEIGYARAKNIPVVVVAESVDERELTMVIGSGCEITNDFATGLYATCWHLMGDV